METAPDVTKPTDLKNALDEAQLQKVQLEIHQLRKPRWLDPFLQILPVITVLVSLVGFLFAAYQYMAAQKKQRFAEQLQQQLKLEEQAREDLQKIVQFPTSDKTTAAELELLLIDLGRVQHLADLQRKNDTDLSDYASQKEPTTIILANQMSDMHFNDPRNIDFADTVLRDWDAYKAYITEHQAFVKAILANQEDALTELRRKNPKYFEKLTTDPESDDYIEPQSNTETRIQFRFFLKLSHSFAAHLELLQDQAVKDHATLLFQAAICNKDVTQNILKKSFNPNDDPKSFDECPKQ